MVFAELISIVKDAINLSINLHQLHVAKNENYTFAETISSSLCSIQQDTHELSSELNPNDKRASVLNHIKEDMEEINSGIQPIISSIRLQKGTLLCARDFAQALQKTQERCDTVKNRLDRLKCSLELGNEFFHAIRRLRPDGEWGENAGKALISHSQERSITAVKNAVNSIPYEPVFPSAIESTSNIPSVNLDATDQIFHFQKLPDAIQCLLRKPAWTGAPSDYVQSIISTISLLWNRWQLDVNNLEFELKSNGLQLQLGSGGKCNVYSAKYVYTAEDHIVHRAEVAVKYIKLNSRNVDMDKACVLREIFLQMSLRSNCIVRTFGACWPSAIRLTDNNMDVDMGINPKFTESQAAEDDIQSGSNDILIVMERMTHNLSRALEGGLVSKFDDKKKILIDVCDALKYLHERNIVHRDLKPQNILLRFHKKSLVGYAKIADFGISRVTEGEDNLSKMTLFKQDTPHAGTPMYLAPEILYSDEEASKISTKLDIWALGIIICDLFSTVGGRTHTWDFRVKKYKHFEKLHEHAMKIENRFLRLAALRCFKERPEQRPSIDNVIFTIAKMKEADYREEMFQLALSYLDGKGEEKNDAYALDLLKEVSDCGHGEASYRLGSYYKSGSSGVNDYGLAVKYFLNSSNHGHVRAKFMLGQCYLNGLGVVKDFQHAFQYFQKASWGGSLGATVRLANCYMKGQGVAKNQSRALELYEQASNIGHAGATFALAKFYSNGRNGIKKDEAHAFELYRKASAGDDRRATAQVGYCYKNGLGVTKNEKRAVEYYLLANDAGHTGATFVLGQCYENGVGVDRNKRRAFEYYQEASRGGNMKGTAQLGYCYINGIGVEKDVEQALEHFRKSSDGGYGNAAFMLGRCYVDGKLGVKDEERAFEQFQKGSSSGSLEATVALGDCYLNGIGVRKDEAMAGKIYDKVIDLKNVEAGLEERLVSN